MEILRNASEAKARFRSCRAAGESLGFVPTMGSLHPGHLSLVERSVRENDRTAVSIFVNPTQFDDPDDLEGYPRDYEADQKLLDDTEADILFFPEARELYADEYRYRLTEGELSRVLEGAHREGHFDGVLTVVMKLLCIVGPDRAYFGEKDWQQYKLIAGMAEAFFLDVEIVPCPLIREPDGLAMSSRNSLLTPEERKIAPLFHRVLSGGGDVISMKRALQANFDVDYVERRSGRVLGAVRLGKVRLIDNVRE
ncbi:MAG: pantoate--beta-alanine ligase [Spirochaetaceae bacterium]|nr:pantoate--beta-alanine ligase [Spirochaetaceae bacterium]MDT8296928.1 pantoate--beta-alanine ligase [Spirochaetaceae bacterium]